MPFYMVSTTAPLEIRERACLAKLITSVHCGVTGEPEHIVKVLFTHRIPLARGSVLHVLGRIKKGRSLEIQDALRKQMPAKISCQMDLPMQQVVLELVEVPASWIMDGGEILPEPGDELMNNWLWGKEALGSVPGSPEQSPDKKNQITPGSPEFIDLF